MWYTDVEAWMPPIYHSIRLDLSMACGAMLITYIPWCFYLIFGKEWIRQLIQMQSILLWTLVSVIEIASCIIYPEWGTSLDARAVGYLNHPTEAWASSKDFISMPVTLLGILIFFAGLKQLRSLLHKWQPIKSYKLQSYIFAVLTGPILFLALRGGWQKLPIVPSDSFYSTDMKNNYAATNKTWYFLYSMKKQTTLLPNHGEKEVALFYKNWQSGKESILDTNSIFKGKNIVLLVAEGWSADMVSYLAGKENITPFFDSLAAISLRFSHAFSTGFRTDQGLMSILSGIPSVGGFNMPNQIHKVQFYPSLAREIKSKDYSTSFVYGGDLNFANLYNYLTISGFDTIISAKDFKKDDNLTDWGVPDHIMVQKAITIIDEQSIPFFSTVMLLSSHAPFDIPFDNNFSEKTDIPSMYKASVKYSDIALRMFFESAKQKPWYNNSIFILTSDHGSTHSGYAGLEDHKRFKIPLIVFAPNDSTGNFSNENNYVCNHFDLPYTILKSVGGDYTKFTFGRNIFATDSSRVAFWNSDNTVGKYSLTHDTIVPYLSRNQSTTLYVDMVKWWFNNLTEVKN